LAHRGLYFRKCPYADSLKRLDAAVTDPDLKTHTTTEHFSYLL